MSARLRHAALPAFAVLITACSSPSPDPAPAPSGSPRYLWWYANELSQQSPPPAEAAGRYSTVVLNPDRADYARELRRLDPQVRLLAYLDLASVRSYDGSRAVVTGVSHADAQRSGWIAKDVRGLPVRWSFEGHLQATVWDRGYQEAWTRHAVGVATQAPWDGLLVDNDLSSLKPYSPKLLAGTSSREQTDEQLRSGLDALVEMAGASVRSRGKVFIPNISDARLEPGRWQAHARFGGGMEENFLTWSGSVPTAPAVYDWGPTGWRTLVDEVGASGATLAQTHVAPTDQRTQLYAFASFLLQAGEGDGWQGEVPDSPRPAFPVEASWDLGWPTGSETVQGGVHTRPFQRGWIAVNPSRSTRQVHVPDGVEDATGRSLNSLSLAPMTAFIGRR